MTGREVGASRRAVPVLIVDDHPVVREGLGIRIARQPDLEVCGEASSAAEALALLDATDPDVAVIGISLVESDGLDLIQRIRGRASRVRMLDWSMYPETLYAERALHAGAMGYINKQEATSRIIEAIRCVLADRAYLSGSMADRLLRRMVGGGPSPGSSATESLVGSRAAGVPPDRKGTDDGRSRRTDETECAYGRDLSPTDQGQARTPEHHRAGAGGHLMGNGEQMTGPVGRRKRRRSPRRRRPTP
jgi:DNA-binding NarL/FixJ family response regulator